MTDDRREDDIRELLLPYSLDQLDAPERARVERALDADAELRAELASLEAVAARMLAGIAPVQAPAHLKSRVLDAVSPGADRPAVAAAAITGAAPAPIPITRARSSRRRFFLPALAGSLAVACVVLALVAFDLAGDLDAQRTKLDAVQARVDRAPERPAGFEDATTHTVSTKGDFGVAQGSLVQVSDDKWILVLNDVPSPGVGKSWQVWTKDSNGLTQNVAQWGAGESTGVLVLDRDDIKEVMVSLEPTTRPVPVPSSAPVADVKV